MLANALTTLTRSHDPNLLVGLETSDDAGVYRLTDELALVQTVDFFPPIVDDAYDFGRIAAANALSDVYAMGGTPKTALNIVGFPPSLPIEILGDILRGGERVIREAGAVIVGGHTIKDKELKYGLAVTGVVHPDKVIANAGARPGDLLFLTKALGTGILTTALKRELVTIEEISPVITQMATLNRLAGECMQQVEAHAATDITGFGLLGHALEMARASSVTIALQAEAVPILPGAKEFAAQGIDTTGGKDNDAFVSASVEFGRFGNDPLRTVLTDPQTSGGLFIAVAAKDAEKFQKLLAAVSLPSRPIGHVTEPGPKAIILE